MIKKLWLSLQTCRRALSKLNSKISKVSPPIWITTSYANFHTLVIVYLKASQLKGLSIIILSTKQCLPLRKVWAISILLTLTPSVLFSVRERQIHQLMISSTIYVYSKLSKNQKMKSSKHKKLQSTRANLSLEQERKNKIYLRGYTTIMRGNKKQTTKTI